MEKENNDILEILREQNKDSASEKQNKKMPEINEPNKNETADLENEAVQAERGLEISETQQDKLLTELGGENGVKEFVNSLSDKEKIALQTKIKELEAKVNQNLQDLKTGFSIPFLPHATHEIISEELGSVFATITLPLMHGVSSGAGLVMGGYSSASWLKNRLALRKARKEQKKMSS